jgi:hypothetical protein
MRIHALAAFALFAVFSGAAAAATDGWYLSTGMMGTRMEYGTGAVPGMSGQQAVYLKSQTGKPSRGVLKRSIALEAWRGQRLRVTLRLKNDGAALGIAGLQIANSNETGVAAQTQKNAPGGAWQVHQFVLDVPENARNLNLNVSLAGKGAVWVDALGLEAVAKDVPLTPSQNQTGWWLSTDRS